MKTIVFSNLRHIAEKGELTQVEFAPDHPLYQAAMSFRETGRNESIALADLLDRPRPYESDRDWQARKATGTAFPFMLAVVGQPIWKRAAIASEIAKQIVGETPVVKPYTARHSWEWRQHVEYGNAYLEKCRRCRAQQIVNNDTGEVLDYFPPKQ